MTQRSPFRYFKTSREIIRLTSAPEEENGSGQGGAVALVSGLGGDALCAAIMTGLAPVVRCSPYAPTPGGIAALQVALRTGEVRTAIDLDQSDFAGSRFGGVSETVPDRIEFLGAVNRPLVCVLHGGDRVFTREPATSMLTSRALNRAEAEAVGQGYAAALNAAPGDITVIVPVEARETAGAWLSDAFVATYRPSRAHRQVRTSDGAQGRDTIRQVIRVIEEAGANASTPRRLTAGAAYGATAS